MTRIRSPTKEKVAPEILPMVERAKRTFGGPLTSASIRAREAVPARC